MQKTLALYLPETQTTIYADSLKELSDQIAAKVEDLARIDTMRKVRNEAGFTIGFVSGLSWRAV